MYSKVVKDLLFCLLPGYLTIFLQLALQVTVTENADMDEENSNFHNSNASLPEMLETTQPANGNLYQEITDNRSEKLTKRPDSNSQDTRNGDAKDSIGHVYETVHDDIVTPL